MNTCLRLLIVSFLISPSVFAFDLLKPQQNEVNLTSELHLIFEHIRPITETESGHVHVILSLDSDPPMARAFADYNEKSTNKAEVLRIKETGDLIEGELRIEIGPDGARRGRAHFPTPNDQFQVKFRIKRSDQVLAAAPPNRESFMPYWRKDTPVVAGWKLEGVYDGTWTWGTERSESVEGKLSGSWRWGEVEGGWHPVGAALVERPKPEQLPLILQAFLPDTQRVDGIEAWAERRLDPAQPLTHAVLRVSLNPLSAEASVEVLPVSVGVKTEAGWFYLYDRLHLSKTAPLEAEFPLNSFGTRWRPFQGQELQAIRMGVVNGRGMGAVKIELTRLEVEDQASAETSADITRIVLRPDVIRAYNGADTVPPGLFGFHDVHHDQVKKPKEGEPDPMEILEEIQPGLLRPLTHTNFGGGHSVSEFFQDKAKRTGAAERVVWVHTMDLWARPPWMDGDFESFLQQVEAFYADMAERSWTPEHPDRVLRSFEVWNEPFMWGRHINMGFRLPPGALDVTDETQYGYIPGKVGAEAWGRIFSAAVKGAKAVNPHVRLGGPSAPGLESHNYADFKNYTLRVIEDVGDRMDFFSEHHYGGNPLTVASGYEAVRAAFQRAHGRTVPIINTEANDLGASDAGKALYNLTEILHLIKTQPDLAEGRALHALWTGELRSSGELDAWRLMAPLRGKILDLSVDSPRLTAVASSPKPGTVVLIGADHGVGDQTIQLSAPEGFRIKSLTLLLTEPPREELRIRDVDGAGIPDIPQGKTELVNVLPRMENREILFGLPPRSGFRLILEKKGFEPYRTRNQRSVLLDAFFTDVSKGKAFSLALPEATRPDPDRLFLRAVMTGAYRLEAGDTVIRIPAQAYRMDQAELRTVEVPPSVLSQNPRLIALDSGATVVTASWVWE